MRKIYLLLVVIFFTTTLSAQYNKKLADSLGADKYGMKSYVLVILKTGKTEITDTAKISAIFRGHMANIGSLANEGKLIIAGPLGKNDKSYRGIFIFNVKTIEEAKTLVQRDPVIQSGVMEAEFYPWYGSAALPMYLKAHKEIEQATH